MTRAKRYLPLIDTIIAESTWSEATKVTANIDANVAFEALLAKYGVEEALRAIEEQGFAQPKEYQYIVKPLHDEACKRRGRKQISK